MQDELFDRVRQLGLPPADFAIFGSGPLIVRRVVAFANDLDLICRGKAWNMALRLGEPEYLEQFDTHIIAIDDGVITLGTKWSIGEIDTDTLIDTAEMIDGLPFVSVCHVAAYKRLRGSAKDHRHLEAMRQAGLLTDSE